MQQIFSFSAVEASVNNLIPNSYYEIKKDGNRKVIDDKEYIEKKYKLTDKIKFVIPNIYKLDFKIGDLSFWESFTKLEIYKNEIIHFKSDEMKNFESKQLEMLTELIFNVIKSDIIESARNLITYLVSQIELLPGLPYEFNKEPIDYEILKQHYSKKNIFNLLEELATTNNNRS